MNDVDIVLRMRRIFCCAGAKFTRRELQAGWEEIERLRERIEELKNLIRAAGPLHWVMHEDAEGAREWEIKAAKETGDD